VIILPIVIVISNHHGIVGRVESNIARSCLTMLPHTTSLLVSLTGVEVIAMPP